MRLLSESKGEISSTYVYEYNSYAPLARLDSWNAEYFAAQGKAVPAASDPGGLGRVYYFHCNASGMPEEMTDRNGNIVWRARYMTWGRLAFENVTSHAPVGFEQNLRMQGQYHDRETGLHYNTFRYYDCDTGRFISEDPIGLLGGMNLYQYAPNPLMWIDPWGWAHLNTNTAGGDFVVYEIYKNDELYKIGKADQSRITKSSGDPTRLHQQLRTLNEKNNPNNDVYKGHIVERGYTTTAEAKSAEKARLDRHYAEHKTIPEGNKKSYFPNGRPKKSKGTSQGCGGVK